MNSPTKCEQQSVIQRLSAVIERLRGKDGCPWDREQTLDSLKPCLIEESYEVLDAVDSKDTDRHKEELGDLLLQVLLHAQIRKEEGSFTFDDVVQTLIDKLVRRHPHVFGDVTVDSTKTVLANWEAIKAAEKKPEDRSVVGGIPRHLPALQKAQRVQSRAARVGFDWPSVDGVLAKIEEELEETKVALAGGSPQRIGEELGDLIFSVVNLSRFQGVNAEESLQGTVRKFICRFQKMEQWVQDEGRSMSDCSLEELEVHWVKAKKMEAEADSSGHCPQR